MSSDAVTAIWSHSSERLLLSELVHRLTNELTAAVGLIDLACMRARTTHARRTLEAVRESLASFAYVHQALQAPQLRTRMNIRPYLRCLCDAIRTAKLQQCGIDLQYADQDLLIDSERCWRLGMIVFELVTNSAKHALRGAAGTIRVELDCVGSIVRCSVKDDGAAPYLSAEPGTGLLIVNALTRELGGTFHQRVDLGGSVSTVRFPLS